MDILGRWGRFLPARYVPPPVLFVAGDDEGEEEGADIPSCGGGDGKRRTKEIGDRKYMLRAQVRALEEYVLALEGAISENEEYIVYLEGMLGGRKRRFSV